MPKPLLPLLNAAPAATRPFDDKARAQMAEWVDNWKRVGPILEAERVAGLRALSETESARIAVELLWPMAPIGGGDAGEGLVRIQAALRRLAKAPVAHHPSSSKPLNAHPIGGSPAACLSAPVRRKTL